MKVCVKYTLFKCKYSLDDQFSPKVLSRISLIRWLQIQVGRGWGWGHSLSYWHWQSFSLRKSQAVDMWYPFWCYEFEDQKMFSVWTSFLRCTLIQSCSSECVWRNRTSPVLVRLSRELKNSKFLSSCLRISDWVWKKRVFHCGLTMMLRFLMTTPSQEQNCWQCWQKRSFFFLFLRVLWLLSSSTVH